MSWRASAYIKQMQDCPNGEPIARSEKFVALILADSHQDKVGAYTYPSVETIAADACMDPRVCRRLLASLEHKGVIQRVRAENQGRGQVTFYRFPELDKERAKSVVNGHAEGGHSVRLLSKKGGQDVRLFYAKRGTEGGQKEDKTRPALKGTVTGTKKQKTSPRLIPPAGAGGSVDSLFPPAGGPGPDSLEAAVEQTMSGCAWLKRGLRKILRAAIALECDKGEAPATTALAIMAAWKFQAENSTMLRGKYGPANFLELGIWKDANLLQWDHERMAEKRRL